MPEQQGQQEPPSPMQPQAQPAGSPWPEPVVGVPLQPVQAAAAPPAAPQLPPDSNAAMVAEVRQLRSKLLQSLQKHAPELEAAGVRLEGSSLTSASKWAQQERQPAEEPAGSPSSGWQLAALSGADVLPPGTTRRSGGLFRLTEQSSLGGAAWPAATGIGSSSKFQTDDSLDAGRQRLTDLGSSFGGAGDGMDPPGSVLGGGGSLARLGSVDAGAFSLDAFEAQTEALRRQLAGL